MNFSQKKVLLVTETPPGTPNGFGVTLDCLFHKIPHCVIYTDEAFKNHGIKMKYLLAQVPFHRSRKYYIYLLLGKIPEWRNKYSKRWLSKNLTEKYSVVYAFIYSIECLNYASWIAETLRKPLVVHVADHNKQFEIEKNLEKLANCAKLICITQEMKIKYEGMLGRKDIEVMHNGANQKCFNIPAPSTSQFSTCNPFIICFIGGLFHHLHGDGIEDLFKAVSLLRKDYPWVEFHLFGERRPKSFLEHEIKKDGIFHHGIIMPLEKKYKIMENANCFIIPSTFNSQNHEHYKFSFPTKLPELIASGRPILSYGPRETATNNFLNNEGIGIRIHNRSVDLLSLKIEELINDYSSAIKDSSCYISFAKKRLSASDTQKKMSKILSNVIL